MKYGTRLNEKGTHLNRAEDSGVGGNIPGSKESKYITVQEKLQHDSPVVKARIRRLQNP